MLETRILSVFWHSVESDSLSPDGTNPTARLFREQIKFLIENYTPISVADFLQIQRDKKLLQSYDKAPVLLGFDDGFKNVLTYALPVLEEFKVPAVFFVIGEIFKNPNFVPWYVERKHLIRKAAKKTVTYANATIDLALSGDRNKLKRLFDVSFKGCTSELDRQKTLTHFANLLDVDRPKGTDLDDDLKFVEPNDLANLPSSSLLTVGSHAMTHRDLATLDSEDQVDELEQSDRLLQVHCPSYYPVLAYPNGSFNAHTINIAKRIYRTGFAVLLGSSFRNLYAYPRIGLGDDSIQELAYTLSAKRRNYVLPVKRLIQATGIGGLTSRPLRLARLKGLGAARPKTGR